MHPITLPPFGRLALRLVFALGLTTLLAGVLPADAAEDRVAFPNSIAPLPAAARSTRRTLAVAETTNRMEFTLALRMRQLSHLQSRVARSEIISREELEATYLPLPADYEALKQWALQEGLTITLEDPSRLLLHVEGTLAQVQSSLQVNLVSVTVNAREWKVADAPPSLPAQVAGRVLGINGLQPYHQRTKRAMRRPHVANEPPYLINEMLGAYNAKNLGVTGAGQTIAILIDTPPQNSDLVMFWNSNSVAQSTNNITTINVNGGTLPAISGEESMDVQWTSGIAPAAKIRVYASRTLNDTDLDKCLQRILADLPLYPGMRQLSISLGLGETYMSEAQFDIDAQLFAALASGGMSIFVSSGDGGSTPDDSGADQGPLQAEHYASDPSVTAVGGTSLTLVPGTGARSSETAWSGSGGGVSIQFTRPSWQTGPGVPAGSMRLVPDVAAVADPETGAFVVVNGEVFQYGGTSLSAPMWAGFCALINQGRTNIGKPTLGLLNPYVYPLIGTSNFHDITVGSNATSLSTNYPATANYDLVTGVGTPNMSNLLATLVAAAVPPPVLTSLSPTSGVQNTAVTLLGSNFYSVTSITFNAISAAFAVQSPTQATAYAPADAGTGPVCLFTTYGAATSATTFTVLPGPPVPLVTGFTPDTGITNSLVTINGQYFTNITGVTFNGTPAAFTVLDTNQLTALVPEGATTGPIAVINDSGSALSPTSFTVLTGDGSPLITSFAPGTGYVGVTVTVLGSNLVSVSGVQFNATPASFVSVTATQLTAVVPASATTGPLSLTSAYGAATSVTDFVIVEAPQSPLTLSQIYGGGGNAGATYANDFVEIYNRSAGSVNLSTCSVQYAAATGTSWTSVPLKGSLAPGQYYLVKLASGGAVGLALPAAGVTNAGLNISATRGKVALLATTTLLASGTSSPLSLPTLIDFVGYGTANAHEGTGPAPAGSATAAVLRINAGATDTGDNASDFTTATPAPRNTGNVPASGLDLALAKTHTGIFTQGQASATYTLAVTNRGSAATTGLVTVAETLPAGLTATAFTGTGWSTTLSPLSATRADALAAGTAYPPLTLTVSVATNAPGTVTNFATVSTAGDTNAANDTAADATLILSPGVGPTGAVVLASWNMSALTNYGPSPLAPNVVSNGNLVVSGFTRGSGLTTSPTAAARAWGANGWATSSATAVTSNKFVTWSVTPQAGYAVSFSAISRFDYRRSGTGPTNGVLQVSLAGGSFSDVATFSYPSTNAALGTTSLAGVASLQSVGPGTNVTFRLVNFGATASGGTWYVHDYANTTNADFELTGSVASTAALTPIETWRQQTFGTNSGNTALAGNLADPDNDGIPNLFEYAFGTAALVPGSLTLAPSNAAGVFSVEWTHATAATDVSLHAWGSTNLADAWSTNGITESQISSDGTNELWRATVPVTDQPQQFLRLQVTQP